MVSIHVIYVVDQVLSLFLTVVLTFSFGWQIYSEQQEVPQLLFWFHRLGFFFFFFLTKLYFPLPQFDHPFSIIFVVVVIVMLFKNEIYAQYVFVCAV